jgi:hypothetical protein
MSCVFLTCSIPEDIANMTTLEVLALGNNELSGALCSCCRNVCMSPSCPHHPSFSGPVPPKICGNTPGSSRLSVLILSNNQLTGDLDLGWCSSLVFLATNVSTMVE